MRSAHFLGVLLLAVTWVAGACHAEVTKEFNGLTFSDVIAALGVPDYKTESVLLGNTSWYYKGARITFKNGRISECELYDKPSAAIAVPSVPIYTPKAYVYPPPSGSVAVPSIRFDTLRTDNTSTQYLGKLSTNRYDSESISNPYGRYGSPYGQTVTNPYSIYGSPYSSKSVSNPYATDAPRIYAADGTYLGKLSSNPYDPESISNPFGKYGSPYGNNLMNPFSKYGSEFSSESWRNPYATRPPSIYSSPNTSFSLHRIPSIGSEGLLGNR